ncbi:MAG: hypothetical protein PHX87_00825 [Candidatus Peribacteraceae bacterium]|nr:hypothetical protein [Candidatus Peribacteraceae bacterium]
MTFLSHLYQIALIIAFFGFVWKFIFLAFAAGSVVWRPTFFIGKAIGYYLLVSLIALQTLVSLEDASFGYAIFMLIFGAILVFFLVGGGMAEVQKEMHQSGSYESYDLLKYDGLFLIGSVIFYIVAMFVPFLAATPPVFWAAHALDWVASIPIVGFLLALYGGWTFLGLLFSMVLYGGIAAVFSAAFLYKKAGFGKAKEAEKIIDVPADTKE